MKAKLRQAWESRAPQERVIIAILAALTAAALYYWLVQTGGQAHTRLQVSVATLRAQAVTLEQYAVELERLRATPVPPESQTDVRTLVQAQVDASGLSGALLKIDAADVNQVVVAFGPVEFAAWLNWVASLKSQHVRLSACRIEALPAPGMVSVTATLLRASQR
jgi:type II secretory pathway component PulM